MLLMTKTVGLWYPLLLFQNQRPVTKTDKPPVIKQA